MTDKYTIEELTEGIRNRDDKILQYIYSDYFPPIEKYILNNSGNSQDASDIFHDSILILYQKLKENSLDINCSLKNYIFGICKVLWLKELKVTGIKTIYPVDLENTFSSEEIEGIEDRERRALFQYHFNRLEEDCRKVLQMFYDGAKLEEIAEIMGYKSENYAKQKKFKCKERLVAMIKNDPRFRKR